MVEFPEFLELYWNLDEAKSFLRKVMPVARRAGYGVKIVGGIRSRSYGKDLDLLLIPIGEAPNFELIMESYPGEFSSDGKIWTHWTLEGKVVDFYIGEDKG